MKTDIIIHTNAGPVGIGINSDGSFNLKGREKAIGHVREAVPALLPDGNENALLGEALARIVLLAANDQAPAANVLVSHEEMQKRTLLDRPIVLFQIRGQFADMLETLRNVMNESHDEAAANTAKILIDDIEETGWITERVFIDYQEATDYVAVQRHRYPEDDENEAWRFYAVSAERSLNQAVRDARDISNL